MSITDQFPSLKFRPAVPMPATPHSYTVRCEQNEAEYAQLFHLIAEHGVWEEFQGKPYRYLYSGPWKYWAMSDELAESKIINRAVVDALGPPPNLTA